MGYSSSRGLSVRMAREFCRRLSFSTLGRSSRVVRFEVMSVLARRKGDEKDLVTVALNFGAATAKASV